MKWSSDVERQQVGIAVGLAADVDQRLALVIAVEEFLRARPARSGSRARPPPSAARAALPGAFGPRLLRTQRRVHDLASPRIGRPYRAARGLRKRLFALGRGEGGSNDRARAPFRAARSVAVAGARSRRSLERLAEARRAPRARRPPAGSRAANSRVGASGITARLLPARSAAVGDVNIRGAQEATRRIWRDKGLVICDAVCRARIPRPRSTLSA